MAEGGFHDFEMRDKDRYRDEDYEEGEDETSFVDAREDPLSPKPMKSVERVDTLKNMKKTAGNMKR